GHTPMDNEYNNEYKNEYNTEYNNDNNNETTNINTIVDNRKLSVEHKQRHFTSITGHHVTWCKCCGCPESWHEINTSTSKSGSVPIPPYKCKRRPHFLETKKTKLCSLTLAQDFLDELYQDKVWKGNETINICSDDSNLNNNGITVSNDSLSIKAVKNVSELKDWYTFNPQGIDWIWEIIDQLKLDGVVATKLIKIDGKIDVENGDINIAIQQRLETGNLIFQ
ncbi:10240_t:CDS:2, partial [Cetraspora pellucida]